MLDKLIKSVDKVSNKDKEGFKEDDESYAIAVIVLFVLWIVLVVFIGTVVWNHVLAKKVSGVKPVSWLEFLALVILAQTLWPTLF